MVGTIMGFFSFWDSKVRKFKAPRFWHDGYGYLTRQDRSGCRKGGLLSSAGQVYGVFGQSQDRLSLGMERYGEADWHTHRL